MELNKEAKQQKHKKQTYTQTGIELTTPDGKNDGSVNGVKYFECPQKYGVLVRPEAVVVIEESFEIDRQNQTQISTTNISPNSTNTNANTHMPGLKTDDQSSITSPDKAHTQQTQTEMSQAQTSNQTAEEEEIRRKSWSRPIGAPATQTNTQTQQTQTQTQQTNTNMHISPTPQSPALLPINPSKLPNQNQQKEQK
jgi:dynactin complex subunit